MNVFQFGERFCLFFNVMDQLANALYSGTRMVIHSLEIKLSTNQKMLFNLGQQPQHNLCFSFLYLSSVELFYFLVTSK